MKIERTDHGVVTVLQISEEIDHADVNLLLEELKSVCADGPRHILLNMNACPSIVSSAIGVLVGWHCESALSSRVFGLVNPSRAIHDVLDQLGLAERLVRPEETEAEALADVCKEFTE